MTLAYKSTGIVIKMSIVRSTLIIMTRNKRKQTKNEGKQKVGVVGLFFSNFHVTAISLTKQYHGITMDFLLRYDLNY